MLAIREDIIRQKLYKSKVFAITLVGSKDRWQAT